MYELGNNFYNLTHNNANKTIFLHLSNSGLEWGLKPIPAVIGRDEGYTLDMLDSLKFALTPTANLKSPNNITQITACLCTGIQTFLL